MIPYQWAPTSDQSTARAVRLFISKDGAATWQPISEAKPDVRGFTYHAEQDGEYLFSIRTIDQYGRAWPAGQHLPELRVIVDTTFPQLEELGGLLTTDGTLDVYWQAADELLDPNGIKIEYLADGTGEWQSIEVPRARPDDAGVVRGQTQLNLPAGTSGVRLRGEVYDRAGNRSVRGAEVTVDRTGITRGGEFPMMITGRSPIPEAIVRQRQLQLQAGTTSHPAAVRDPFASPAELPDANGWQAVAEPAAIAPRTAVPAASQPWPAHTIAAGPPASGAATPGLSDQTVYQSAQSNAIASSQEQGAPSFGPLEPYRQASNMSAQASTRSMTQTPSAGTNEFLAALPVEAQPEHANSVQPAWRDQFGADLPADVEPMMVGSRTFDLEYGVESAGHWGVSRVELWGTRDAGQNWRTYALDDDHRSPLRVTVEGDGVYGFRIVAHSAGGLAATRPQPGDAPELWVGVDLQRPQAELLSVMQGTGNLADHLVFRWRAEDANLPPRPVALFYSSHRGGPWSAVATGLENSGQYAWRLERHLPTRFFLRLEVRDTAGNLASFETNEPVELHRAQPSARLRGVRPPATAAP